MRRRHPTGQANWRDGLAMIAIFLFLVSLGLASMLYALVMFARESTHGARHRSHSLVVRPTNSGTHRVIPIRRGLIQRASKERSGGFMAEGSKDCPVCNVGRRSALALQVIRK